MIEDEKIKMKAIICQSSVDEKAFCSNCNKFGHFNETCRSKNDVNVRP